jgi:lipid A 3-O-deacylase
MLAPMVRHASAALFLASCGATSLLAVDEPPPPDDRARDAGIFTLYFENDFFGGQDRHYTNGLKLSWLSSDLETWDLRSWRRRFAESLPFINRPDTQKNVGFAFGQNIYVPQDISRVPPDPTDRPYAGWSYLEFSLTSKTDTRMDTLSLQVGLVGRHSYAQDLQVIVHEWLNDEQPDGWGYQLRDEPGVNLIYERKWRAYWRTRNNGFGVDLIPTAGVSLGNVQTYASAGLEMRLGFNVPSDFGVSLINGLPASHAPVDDRDPRVSPWGRRRGIFAFAGGVGRAVARDLFLDGNTFRSSPSVDKEPLVGDAFYGLGVILGRWQITYTEAVRTREFKGQRDMNYFGSIAISRTF